MATILTSLESPISNDDVVTFALEGLPVKYENVSGIIVHREPFPNLKTGRSMLTTDEMILKSKTQSLHVDSSSSSPMVLLAESGNSSRRATVETVLSHPLSAMTLQDPSTGAWNIDTCASSHLNDSVHSLSDVLNMCLYPSVFVGDGYTILVTNTGHTYGTLSRYKARLVTNGSKNLSGIDVDETFSPVVKPDTIWTVPSLATSRHCRFISLMSKNAFVHGDLSETVYMHQPLGFLSGLIWLIVTPVVDTEFKLGYDGDLVSYPTLYRSLAGALQYLTFSRHDISYVVQPVCLYMHDPREPYFSALKRILRYVRGTLHHGLQLFSSSTTSLVAYSDPNWAGCPTTQRSTSGYCVFVENNLLSWSFKRQPTLSQSIVEAEYRGVAGTFGAGHVRVLRVPSRYHYAYIFTKSSPSALFEEFLSSLSVRCSLAQIAREC
ncbi:ribonuclease H-like domain-containing protein [Tanacetum coccineum]